MPTFLRNLRTLTLKTSSFMIASPKCRKDGRRRVTLADPYQMRGVQTTQSANDGKQGR
jgi:hypothetical protein